MPIPGRPKSPHPCPSVTLRLDPRALTYWQVKGQGWRRERAIRLELAARFRRETLPASGSDGQVGNGQACCRSDTDALLTLIHGDCRKVDLPAFDAILTDPPYGIGYESRHDKRKQSESKWTHYVRDTNIAPIVGDDAPFDPAWLIQLAGDKPTVLWGANDYANRLPTSGCWLIWDKRESSRPNDQADCEMAWSNLKGPSRLYSHLWIGLSRRGEENRSRGDRKLHPNQKPVALMDWVLDQAGIQPGQTVLDPYMGSGSLGVACIRRGIRYVGVEIDAGYFHVAKIRLEAEHGDRSTVV